MYVNRAILTCQCLIPLLVISELSDIDCLDAVVNLVSVGELWDKTHLLSSAANTNHFIQVD